MVFTWIIDLTQFNKIDVNYLRASIQATVVPESSLVLGLLALTAFGAGSVVKRKLK